ncbi:hypothetical protein JR044_31205 [Pseudomonas aeruginosa]|uniref:hypothetical protein n=1 Tax=Pseudomonas aeruginosa TaxID=287 RepID=UPI001BD4F617|nr:hypothetical protein [Pseudomonas aeruginosa]MBS9758464.1 hypothetical protein [Pseudomonas aeruginosa]
MIVIGLAGGTAPGREAIAQRLHEAGGQQLVVWGLKGDRLNDGRARAVARALDGMQEPACRLADGIVLTHVLTEEEADVIRANGGQLWHVFGPVSSAVVIRRGDLLVTTKEGGDRHWLDPIEALSEALLSQARGR